MRLAVALGVGALLTLALAVYRPPAPVVLAAQVGPGAVTNPALDVITDVTKFAWDVQTNPAQFYDASGHYRGQLRYTTAGGGRLAFTSGNPTGATALLLGESNSSLTLADATGMIEAGAWNWQYSPITANTTLDATQQTVGADATAGALVVTLPGASALGRTYRVKKIDSSANTVTIQRGGSDTIEGATSVVLKTQWAWLELVADGGTTWQVYGR